MNEKEFRDDLSLIEHELGVAIKSFYTYTDIHNLASEDPSVLQRLNTNAAFWNIVLLALENNFYIALGRVFDNAATAHSIHKVINACVDNPEFFSKEALAQRKIKAVDEQNGAAKTIPTWLDQYIANAYEPRVTDLRDLKKPVSKCRKTFDGVYRDIRNKVIAHRELKDIDVISQLFSEIQIAEIEGMLYSLHDLLNAIWELYLNGRRPRLGEGTYDYKDRVAVTTKRVIDSLQ